MDKPEFTPGPWHIGPENGRSFVKNGEKIVAQVFDETFRDLIAAAPELYAALNNLTDTARTHALLDDSDLDEPIWEAIRQARVALAKAKSENQEADNG